MPDDFQSGKEVKESLAAEWLVLCWCDVMIESLTLTNFTTTFNETNNYEKKKYKY